MSKIIYIPAPASTSGFVPYTGATASVNLSSSYYIYARNFKTLGTAGYGHYSARHQSAGILAGANESNLFADVNGNLAWQNSTLYRNVFSTNANTANRTYTFQNKDYRVADNADLARYSEASSVAEFLRMFPEHRFAVHRVQQTQGLRYPEIHDNLLAEDFLPLSVQRFQLAVYGMNNFSPQSTDWLRVTLFSGAPRTADLGRETSDADDWLFPLAPPSKPSLEKESRP